MTEWRDILGWNDEHLEDLRFTGFLLLREARYEQAKRFFEGLALLNPKGAYDLRMLGTVYLLTKEYDKAIEALTKALEKEPGHLGAELNLAKAWLYKGQREQGLAVARKLINCPEKMIAGDAAALVLAYSNE